MKPLVFDYETTSFKKGNPFSQRNKPVLWGTTSDGYEYNIGYRSTNLPDLTDVLLIGHNIGFDLQWLRRERGSVPDSLRVWDTMLAEFLLSNQRRRFPSLDESCELRGLDRKIDVVKTEYWDKGLDTENVPEEILTEYLTQDLDSTYQLWQAQLSDFKKNPQLFRLFQLQCRDLLVLVEMTANGMLCDLDKAKAKAAEAEQRRDQIEYTIRTRLDVPACANLNSGDHLSAILYGGKITEVQRIPVGVYKTGSKAGLPRFKLVEFKHEMPRVFMPPKGSELKKEGFFATGEDVLRSIKTIKKTGEVIDLILEHAGLEKLIGTYYKGIPELLSEYEWGDVIHSQLNQCVAVTGRLSSSQPNQQNYPPEWKTCLRSRYD